MSSATPTEGATALAAGTAGTATQGAALIGTTGNHYVISAIRTVQVLSPTVAQDVEYVTYATLPTNISYAVAIPIAEWTGPGSSGILSAAGQAAMRLESLVGQHHVVAGSAVQEIDPNGLLADMVEVIVQYDRPSLPPLQGAVTFPIGSVYFVEGLPGSGTGSSVDAAALCDAEYARLQTLATSG